MVCRSRPRRFFQVAGVAAYRADVKQTGQRREGLLSRASRPPLKKGELSRALPFHLCPCVSQGQATICGKHCPAKAWSVLDSPPPVSDPPADVAPQPPREPVLTLPRALTAYIVLLAVVHLRVLLPP